MKLISRTLCASLALSLATTFTGSTVCAESLDMSRGEYVREVFNRSLPNAQGKSLKVVEVDYRAGGRSPPHHHAPSAFIYAYVLSGAVRSQVAGEPVHVYKAGESFFEAPGAHHLLGENASSTRAAKLLAVFVVDSHDEPLTTPDARR